MAVGSATLLTPEDPEWQTHLGRVWHQIYQRPEYVALEADRTAATARAFLYTEREHALLLPLLLRCIGGTDWLDATSPYGYPGPVSDTDDDAFWRRAVVSLRKTLVAGGVVSLFIRLDPLMPWSPRPLSEIGTLVQHGNTVCVDLRIPHDVWLSRIRRSHRQAIRRAHRFGRSCVMDDWDHLDLFVDNYYQTLDRVGATPEYYFPREYFRELRRRFDDQVHLQIAFDGDEYLMGTLLLEGGGVLQSHLGGEPAVPSSEPTSKYIVDHAVRWGAARGLHALHLGGGLGGAEDSIFDYKRGFASEQRPFLTFRAVLDPAAYRRLCEDAGQSCYGDVEGYFPLYRKPILH